MRTPVNCDAAAGSAVFVVCGTSNMRSAASPDTGCYLPGYSVQSRLVQHVLANADHHAMLHAVSSSAFATFLRRFLQQPQGARITIVTIP
mmetsp:Transcript_11980/g.28606  ORF Transcript_11980/g.28606 Transcript_11980/m.28606 type:complete len:90 (+) Transcript_11980:331-600(+)